ncbi:MAG: phosphotransferase [Myxococcales bacterium]|nr:phosphotransferase [Myxococcales bacterium]
MRQAQQDLKQLIEAEAKRLLAADGDIELDSLGGHASYRLYHRVRRGDRSLMLMELRGDPLASEEASGGERPRELPFLTVQRYLSAGGLPVPEVYAYLEAQGLLLLEDLGDQTFEDIVAPLDDSARRAHYERAIDLLLRFQRHSLTARDALCHSRRFTEALLRWELDHFVEWMLEVQRGGELDERERRIVEQHFDTIARELAALPPLLAHRDYQSRNLMLQVTDEGSRLCLIDFQDALLAPPTYDMVALLRDSYVHLGVPLVDTLIGYYLERGGAELMGELGVDPDDYRRLFWLQTVQRKLKDAGRFVFIERVKNNDSFLVHIPRTLRTIVEAFEHIPHLLELRDVLGAHVEELAR